MLRSKLPESNKTIFSEIKELAEKNNAVDLASGLPEAGMPEILSDLVCKYVKEGRNQYAPVEGIRELRETIAGFYSEHSARQFDAEKEITITAGSTQAVWAAVSAIVHEDDEVIIIEPSYESYIPAVRLNGGTPIFVSLKAPDYHIDWSETLGMINQRTKMIIINTPHSPTGSVFTDDDYKNLQKIVAGSKIVVLCDETFANLTYEKPYVGISKYPLLAKQTVIISSFSKSLNATGWKTGYCIAPEDYTKEIRRIHNYMINGSNSIMQYALAELLKTDDTIFDTVRDEYRKKRDFLCSLLEGSKYKLTPTKGTWFQTVDFSQVSSLSDKEFVLKLIKEYNVAVYPLSAYYHDKTKSHTIRICFARPDDVIKKGVECLLKAQKS